MAISFHDLSKMTRTARDQLLKRSEADLAEFEEKVKPIVFAVQHEGDEAVARFARQLRHGFRKRHPFFFDEIGENVSADFAAETIITALAVISVEAWRFLAMKRATGPEITLAGI